MSALDGLQNSISEFNDLDVRIVAISPDSVSENQEVANSLGLEFPILSDTNLELTRALSLLHEGAGMLEHRKDVPRPAVFIVKDGEIRWRALTDNWRIRVRPDALLEAVQSVVGG